MDFIPNEIKSEGMVKIRIEAVGGDLGRVACRYPLSFMDEMARQLTSVIEAATGTTGIADSSVELVFGFATTTFMEHISGNVTYRRLMLVDAVSAPRDFWIKWTRLDNCDEGYNESNILFELGEDVEQKIRQREYRYLLQSSGDKYHNSMSRKKVTEWREVIKRAAKRGELSFVEKDYELTAETLELEERIADLLGKRIVAKSEPKKEEIPYIRPEEDDEFARAMAKARMVVEASAEESGEELTLADIADQIVAEQTETDDEPEEVVLPEPELTIDEELEIEEESEVLVLESESEEIAEPVDEPAGEMRDGEFDIFADLESDEDEIDIFDEEQILTQTVETVEEEPEIEIEILEEEITEEEPEFEIEIVEQTEEDPVDQIVEEIPEEEEIPEAVEEEPEIEIEIAKEPIEAEENADIEIVEAPKEEPKAESRGENIVDRIADIRAELETKIRLEYESRARIKAEEELVLLRRELQRVKSESESIISDLVKENERLRVEYEHLLDESQRDVLLREAETARRRAEEEQLRAQIEAQLRQEASERERLAEAARLAIEEQRRLEAENARIAREREEEERAEAERQRRIEEEKAIEAVRQAELDRIRKEEAAQKARAKAAMPSMGNGRYSYTSKTVKFLFRRSVDPNITTRIQEIIKATVDYYGKDNVYLKIKATVPDTQTVVLEFVNIPIEEMELLGNIIKIIGNSGLGVAKAIID